MVCGEVRETDRGKSRRGPSERTNGHPARRSLGIAPFPLDTGIRPVSNTSQSEALTRRRDA
jgi:hypothetical protein